MAKKRIIVHMNTNESTIKAVAHQAYEQARKGHVGHVNRASTIPNKRRQASREACRKGNF